MGRLWHQKGMRIGFSSCVSLKSITDPKMNLTCERLSQVVSEMNLKPELRNRPSSQVTFSKSMKICIICIRNTCPNVSKSVPKCFRDTQDMFCCENGVKTHDLRWLVKQGKFTILTWSCLSEFGFALVVSKDPRQQSTKVEKLKWQYLSFKKHPKF